MARTAYPTIQALEQKYTSSSCFPGGTGADWVLTM